MKNFNIKTCPICGSLLNTQYVDGHTTQYRCPTMYHTDKLSLPHYVIQIVDGMMEQRSIIPPYTMISAIGSGRTHIYHTEAPNGGTGFIMDVPTTLPTDSPEKLAQRIKNLIIFS